MPFSTDRVTEQIFHGCIPAKLKPVLLWLALHIEDVNDDLPRQHRREKSSLPAILQTSSYSSFITQIFTEKADKPMHAKQKKKSVLIVRNNNTVLTELK